MCILTFGCQIVSMEVVVMDTPSSSILSITPQDVVALLFIYFLSTFYLYQTGR